MPVPKPEIEPWPVITLLTVTPPHMVMNVRCVHVIFHDKWVPVTTAWRVFRLLMKKRPPPPLIWMVAANLLNKVLGTAGKGWSSSLRLGRGVNNSSPLRCGMLRNTGLVKIMLTLNPLNTKLNPICHLLALLAAHHILHVSSMRVNTKHWIFRLALTAFCLMVILL
jgi:hypothetical protein